MLTKTDPELSSARGSKGLASSKRRRVAFLITDMNAAGGIQRVAANLVRDLGEWYDTSLLSVDPLSNPVFFEEGMDFQSLNVPRRFAKSRMRLLAELITIGSKLRRTVEQQRIDTVVALWYDMASVAALALPSTVKRIGCEHISYWQATRTWRLIRKLAYRRLDAVVGLTNEDLPLLTQISRRATVIPNYVELAPLPVTSEREKILLSVGHLDHRKGFDRLLWALKQTLLDNPDWKLVVVGGGEKGHTDPVYLGYLANLINVLQLTGRVEFYPATSQIEEWYRKASIYVMGSRMEGLPMVLIEAKAHGLPVVSFDCPSGPKEIVRNGVDGYLIPNDGLEFGRAASNLIRDPDLWQRMSAASREDVLQRFSRAAVLNRWHQLIEDLHSPVVG